MTINTERLKTDVVYWDKVARDSGCLSFGTPATICGIPRPTKPAAPEWDVVEAELHEGEDCWYEAVVIGETLDGRRKVVQWVDDAMSTNSVDALPPSRIRSLRTKEQRERDELASFLTDFFFDDVSETLKPEDIAEAIIAAGYRKEKQDD